MRMLVGRTTAMLCATILALTCVGQSSTTHALLDYVEASTSCFEFGDGALVLSAANSADLELPPKLVSRLFSTEGEVLETHFYELDNNLLQPGFHGSATQLNDTLFAWVFILYGVETIAVFNYDFISCEVHALVTQDTYTEFFAIDQLIPNGSEIALFGQQTTNGQPDGILCNYNLDDNSEAVLEDDLLEPFVAERIRSAYLYGADYCAGGNYSHLNSDEEVVKSPFCAKINSDGSASWEHSFGSGELNEGPATVSHNYDENTVEAFYPKSINQLSSAPWAVEGPIARRSYTPDGTFVSEVELGPSLLVPTVNDVLRTEEHTYVLGTHIHLESDNRLSCLLKLNAAGELVWFQNIIPEYCDDCDGELQNIQPLGDGFIASGRKRTFTDEGAIVDSTWVTVLDCFGHVTPPSLTDSLVYTVSDDGVLQASLGSAAFNNPIWTVDGNTFTGSELNTSFDESGTYTVDLQVDYCATSLTASFEVDVTVNVGEMVFDAARISPNPSEGLIQLTGLPRNTTVNIYDLRGKHVATLNPLGSSAQVQAAPGVYLLVLQQGKAALRLKAVVN